MTSDLEAGSERTPLLHPNRLSQLQHEQDEEAQSIISSAVTKEEHQLAGSTVGERLPYNDYTTIDWLHDLVKDSYRFRYIQSRRGYRYTLLSLFDACSGWIAVVIIGALTACVAFVVDVAVATVSDWKLGYCSSNPFLNREGCCKEQTPLLLRASSELSTEECAAWHGWSESYGKSFAIYVGMALVFGVISSSATMQTKGSLPSVGSDEQASTPTDASKANGPVVSVGEHMSESSNSKPTVPAGKVMYMAAGSGIPEIKTILSGFSIPSFLSLRVLVVKAFGAIFAVSTGMCLGKEGPFVHISTCVGYLVGNLFPKYRDNGRKMRELLSAACSSGLSVAFGAPIGGVLFSYEEISTYFTKKVLWRAFLCSLVAAMVLKALNPTGTGKLVLFETNYGTDYEPIHYLVFILLGVAGGVFGGLFCKLNFIWSKWFRSFSLIKKNPVLEVFIVVLATALLQFPNPLTREPGDIIIKNLLVDCNDGSPSALSWVCHNEAPSATTNWSYIGYLLYGTLTKLLLTIITFGIKVPSGVIIPALDAGALFGRLVGQLLPSISPGIFAMVGSAAFLAGVSRMTISLAVIMFELTGQLSYVVPHMLAILVAKWVADAISSESVYDLAQNVLGHPFLDPDVALQIVRKRNMTVHVLIPPARTMQEITVHVPPSNCVPHALLAAKLNQLRDRGLMDAGLVLVQTHHNSSTPILQGYIAQSELAFGLANLVPASQDPEAFQIRLLGHQVDDAPAPETLEVDLSPFVDRTPLALCAKAPLEYAVEMFSKLGLRYLCVTEEGTGALVGVVLKKRLVGFLEGLGEE
ncbi:chloride channel-like protein 3 [Dothidotthia symphoricarpi CBS 119687]|uniref:Chloride channel protein n=1 Tax=Dothidotthia symphoricarpi CBS 119687 TaxID=1392245 RepID=A0A6A6AMS2_9PLEO|nr:chloride channel-like protein 3 [Dothidotthia symphoricarpi CBS 119687]KAF2131781.1 chloride channel-like protein 3 [Dothidotthia symphoricarpi CBS 119687]